MRVMLLVNPAQLASDEGQNNNWGRALYERKNEIAKRMFADSGAIYLNTTMAVKSRRLIDHNWFFDGLHACNLAPTSFPMWRSRHLLHILANLIIPHNKIPGFR